jgi:hypothetical protein
VGNSSSPSSIRSRSRSNSEASIESVTVIPDAEANSSPSACR